MARDEVQQQGLMPSIVDRLIDPEAGGAQWRFGYTLEQVVDAVRRDLEDLLNSHPAYTTIPDRFAETNTCVLQYGLPDLVSRDASSGEKRAELGKMIEAVIHRYEPRLRDVRAVLVDTGEGGERAVRFHIEARVNADPAPEVAFETVLELMTGHATIKPRE